EAGRHNGPTGPTAGRLLDRECAHMRTTLLTRQRIVFSQEVQEPTLLAIVLTITGFAVLFAVCVVAIAGLPAFGYIWWTFAAVAAWAGMRSMATNGWRV